MEPCSMCGEPMEGHGHWNACQTPERVLDRLRKVVDEQAEDHGLWFEAKYITEHNLQRALRRLHAAIEGKTEEECARAAMNKWAGK